MASAEEMEAACERWLRSRAGQLRLQRTLYLVPGLDDEDGGCWSGSGRTLYEYWGPKVFQNWNAASSETAGSAQWDAATVRFIRFPGNYPDAAFSGTDFRDFGLYLRQLIAKHYPDRGAQMGEYDIVGHSMGGLDAMSALLPLNPPTGDGGVASIARAYNFATLDTPYRGVPNMSIRMGMSPARSQGQCKAISEGSAELKLVADNAGALANRVTRITCYGVESASQVEVKSANLYADKVTFEHQRYITDYRFLKIPGSSHSSGLGLTRSTISIANLFDTLTRSDRLSALR